MFSIRHEESLARTFDRRNRCINNLLFFFHTKKSTKTPIGYCIYSNDQYIKIMDNTYSEVPLWKTYRWVDWARKHGLYEAYDCPRNRFVMVFGLLKLSHAPHLLDVQSTESITAAFRDEQDFKNSKTNANKKGNKDKERERLEMEALIHQLQQLKDELRDWVLFDSISTFVLRVDNSYFPSMYQFTSTASHPSVRSMKNAPGKFVDVPIPRGAPLYLQIDNYERNLLKISMQVLNPRILFNCGVAISEYCQYAYFILERFEWFVDCDIAVAKAHIETNGYDSLEISFDPGRHYCRIWVHSSIAFHIALLSESSLLLGNRDQIMAASVKECPWASRFLNNLGLCFNTWLKGNRNINHHSPHRFDRDFFAAYQPDLGWDEKIVGYKKQLLHWMFRKALEAVLVQKLNVVDLYPVCMTLRYFFRDPDFGFPPKPPPPKPLRDIIATDPCDCKVPIPEGEEVEITHEELERETAAIEEKSAVSSEIMRQLLNEPDPLHPSYICEYATSNLLCGILKEEREKFIVKNEAATVIQSYWRGTWARKCLKSNVVVTQDVIKILNDYVFGNLESLSSLMLEFFRRYPGAKYSYSIASALSGMNGIRQYIGTSPVTPKCKWVPFFQGVFHCHAPVKVHLDVQCNLAQAYCTVSIYDNDTQIQLPQAFNTHITFDITPNNLGYTIIGHGTLSQPLNGYSDIHWQLTVLTSTDKVFHVCDREVEPCKEVTLPSASKYHIDEIYLPNKKFILGGIQIAVTKDEAINFRAAASDPELEIEAVLKTEDRYGNVIECAKCSGKGELFWPFIRLAPIESVDTIVEKEKPRTKSQNSVQVSIPSNTQEFPKNAAASTRSLKTPKKGTPASGNKKAPAKGNSHKPSKVQFSSYVEEFDEVSKTKISSRISITPIIKEPQVREGKNDKPNVVIDSMTKVYHIDDSIGENPVFFLEHERASLESFSRVTAPNGWPLNLAQWFRVKEILNSPDFAKVENVAKKNPREGKTGKEKDKEKSMVSLHRPASPIAGDAYTELECSVANNGAAIATRDDQRDLKYLAEKKSWDAVEAGRTSKCAQFRKEFRTEFLEVIPSPPVVEEQLVEEMTLLDVSEVVESKAEDDATQGQGPTPVTEGSSISEESEEETVFLTMPEQLKDKFIPLAFVPACTKEVDEENKIIISSELKEELIQKERTQIEMAKNRMTELQNYNETYVLGRQKQRTQLIETVFIDSNWSPDLSMALEERDEAIAQEVLARQLSATKRKADLQKKLEIKKMEGKQALPRKK